MNKKICVKCNRLLDFCFFHKQSNNKLGISSYCKECNRKNLLARRNKINPNRMTRRSENDITGNGVNIIYLTKDKQCLVDKEDYDMLVKYRWSYGTHGYAHSRINKHKPLQLMHRLILNIKDRNVIVDHIDGNKLNNKKENLRICSRAENIRHRSNLTKTNKSGKVGVCFSKKNQKWKAYIQINKKMKTLGSFNNIEDAIKVRIEAEKKYFGEFSPIV